jgi:type I restriction enzyme S subunit
LEHIESNTGVRIGSVDVEMSELTGRKPRFYKGDIVYGYLRPYLNKVWIAEFDGLCSVDQYTYKVDDKRADTSFVAWFMRSPVYLERAPINTTPGQLPRIRTEEVASVEINLPPLEEQIRISLQISEKLDAAKNIVDTLESQLAEINRLPASLLREAFAGQG